MSAAQPDAAGSDRSTGGAAERRRVEPWWLVIRIVAAVVFAYVTVQAVGNLVGVQRLISQFNEFVQGSTVSQRPIPWAFLVIDVLMAPIAFVVAWLVARRTDPGRTIVVFLAALCAVGALWFTLAQVVQPFVTLPAVS